MTTTNSEALAVAIRHHQGGRLQEAEQIYRQILQADPTHPDAYHLLGVIARDVGQCDVAVQLIARAIQLRENSAEFYYNLAGAYFDLQKNAEACTCYQRAIDLKPEFVEAHYNLGNVFRRLGQLIQAVACYSRTVQLRPDFAVGYFNLAVTLNELGRKEDALQLYGRVLELHPNDLEVIGNIGNLWQDLGKLDKAIACHTRALQLNPNSAEAHQNLGQALLEQGKRGEAITCFRRALELKPDFASAHANLGLALKRLGNLEEAVECYRRAVTLKPDFPEAYNNLGNALIDMGNPSAAISCFQKALELRPQGADTYNNLGNAWKALSKFEDAADCYRQALQLKPDNPEALSSLGDVSTSLGKLDDAVACCRRALEFRPDYAAAHNNLACALLYQGLPDAACASYRRAVEAKTDYAAAHSNALLALQYCEDVTLATLLQAHAEFDRQHAAPLMPTVAPPTVARNRLRVGFVSADLGRHPVGLFLIDVFEHLREHDVEIICYSDRVVKDDLTQRFQTVATHWHDVAGLNHERLAQQIRSDQSDILIDLAGHTSNNRLLVFARKPAPIQMTWLGYVGTTGLRAMDYLLADHHLIPVDSEKHYSEDVLRMPDDYACYSEPTDAPAVGPLPALKQGFITFGSLNNLSKVTPKVVETWARVLRGVPQSRLIIRYRGLDDTGTRNRFLELFGRHGVAFDRLQLLGFSPRAVRMELYHQIDIGLDPFPYSGATTTCDALWMGVPVVSCPLETFASRQSLTHLKTVQLSELVAEDVDDYVAIAIALANDLPKLTQLRSGLRERMAASPLCDSERFAANFMSILQTAWKQGGKK
jgi:protein O-GlcNAc transferase